MAYLISEEGRELLSDVKRFCESRMKTQCRSWDETGEWPAECIEAAMELGYHTFDIPEEFGGPGISRVDTAALMEEIAMADAGFAVTLSASGLGLRPVLLAGSREQKEHCCGRILDGGLAAFCMTEPQAGSDAAAGTATAVKEGGFYVLNGTKCFITNGSKASFYTVTAKTDQNAGTAGISMFLVDADTPGVKTGTSENKMGIRSSDTCEVVFEDCRIPEENRIGAEGEGFSIAMRTLDEGRAWMACIAAGIAQRGIDEAVAYGKVRRQFGHPLVRQQALRHKLADMAVKTETARQMTAHALTRLDLGEDCRAEAAIAKCYASDIAMEVASEAIQIFGGCGYSREYPVEKLLRDAKIFQIFEGTNEILRTVIAGRVIGEK